MVKPSLQLGQKLLQFSFGDEVHTFEAVSQGVLKADAHHDMLQTLRRHAVLKLSMSEAWLQAPNEDLVLGWVLARWWHLSPEGLLQKLACRLCCRA